MVKVVDHDDLEWSALRRKERGAGGFHPLLCLLELRKKLPMQPVKSIDMETASELFNHLHKKVGRFFKGLGLGTQPNRRGKERRDCKPTFEPLCRAAKFQERDGQVSDVFAVQSRHGSADKSIAGFVGNLLAALVVEMGGLLEAGIGAEHVSQLQENVMCLYGPLV
jgi:hypothetical protein